MRAQGNGLPEVCVQNLMQTLRGEVPYSRIKGLDPTNIDRPAEYARAEVEADAQWVINTYEPRVDAEKAVYQALSTTNGDYELGAEIRERR